MIWYIATLTLKEPENKIVGFANSVGPEEAAHYEAPLFGPILLAL